jgi:hypothetical protein
MQAMSNEEQELLKTDDGIICIALMVYAQFIEEMGGNTKLYDRVMELYHERRNADINIVKETE